MTPEMAAVAQKILDSTSYVCVYLPSLSVEMVAVKYIYP